MSFSKKPKSINPDEVDPSVYYYDEIYDDMKNDQNSEDKFTKRDKSPKRSKYIDGLKETAELRKTEKEIRKFKSYAKDRQKSELEGSLSKEDIYISDSYKRKLKEIKKLEAEKESRHERDTNRSMHFIKKFKTHSSNDTSSHRKQRSSSPDTSQSATQQGAEEAEPPECDFVMQQRVAPIRRPRTLKERRIYLREVLKKRTVGKIYEEALQRYMERRALSQR